MRHSKAGTRVSKTEAVAWKCAGCASTVAQSAALIVVAQFASAKLTLFSVLYSDNPQTICAGKQQQSFTFIINIRAQHHRSTTPT
jgi:hypothetical protein